MLKDLVSLNMVKLTFFAQRVLKKECQFFLKTLVKGGLQLSMACYLDLLIQEVDVKLQEVSKVEELPLAVCDVSSNEPGDLLLMDLKYRDRDGEIYVLRHSPKHKWIYFPEMLSSQALLLKTYDSETDGRARFMAHSTFEDPNTPENAIPRESIEVRTMAFF